LNSHNDHNSKRDSAAPRSGQDGHRVGEIDVRQSRVYEFFKRLLDLVAASIILVLLIPVIPAIAIMIKLDSPGSVFFKQDRVGRFGKMFKFYKFRSMYREAEGRREEVETLNEQEGPVFKIRSDPRVTPVGNFLRRSSLDEIPQIFNVLKGEMSLVGPRPHLPREVEQYEKWHRLRLEVKPGITCLWQTLGRSQIAFDEWMNLDIEYLERRSVWTDLSILLKTIPAVMARRGAY